MTLRADEGDTWTVGDGTTLVTGSLGGLLLWLARRLDHDVRASRAPAILRPRRLTVASRRWPLRVSGLRRVSWSGRYRP